MTSREFYDIVVLMRAAQRTAADPNAKAEVREKCAKNAREFEFMVDSEIDRVQEILRNRI